MKKNYFTWLTFNHNLTNLLAAFALVCLGAFQLQAQSDATVVITAPESVAGDYAARQAVFGPGLTEELSGPVVAAMDTSTTTFTACAEVTNDLSGAIALIDRGACSFVQKVLNAQAAGAIGVIVCNSNAAVPTQAIVMGGDDMGAVTIPSVMIPYQQCQEIRAELGNGLTATLSGTGVAPEAGEICDTAIEIGPGTTTVDAVDSGFGAIFAGAANAVWYSYTPTQDALVTVSSCALTDVDTRVVVLGGPDCDPANLAVIAFNDDCDPDNGNFASETSFLATAGTRYFVYWDDPWSNEGFDFEIVEGELPAVDVTFNVNMALEEVSEDGVSMVYAGPGAGGLEDVTVVELADEDGDGTWSGTATLTALDTIGYAFVNGAVSPPDAPAVEAVPDDCGLPSGFGFNIRPLIVSATAPINLSPVCFGLCENCPAASCDDPTVIISEDFEGQTAGEQPDLDFIIPWPGTSNLGLVSADFAASGSNSHRITGTGTDVDPVYLLASEPITSGHYVVQWNMLVPEGNLAYYNFQKTETPGTEWAFQLYFDGDGTGRLEAGSASEAEPRATFEYPEGEFFTVVNVLDVDNNLVRVHVDGKFISSWPLTYQPFETTGRQSFAGVNFYPANSNNLWYVDDFQFLQIPEPAEGLYCQTATPIDAGGTTVGELDCFGGGIFFDDEGDGLQSRWYSFTPEEDGFINVSSCNAPEDTRVYILGGTCDDLDIISANDDRCLMSTGDPYASLAEAAVTAGETYYIVWDDYWSANGFDFRLTFTGGELPAGNFCASAVAVEPGVHMAESFGEASVGSGLLGASSNPSSAVFSPQMYGGATWFSYTPTEDGLVSINSCGSGVDTYVTVYTGSCDNQSTLEVVASNDDGPSGCSPGSEILDLEVTAGTTYYIEWMDIFDEDPFEWELNILLPGDVCSTSENIQEAFEGEFGSTVSVGPFDNTNYTTTPQDPDFGWECFGEPDGGGSAPSLERTMWYTFEGDGGAYFIEALGCGEDPIDFDDTQFVIYSGSCDELEAVLCSEDGPNSADGFFPAGDTLQTESGVTYYLMVDGFGPDFPADGEYCIEVTSLTEATVTVTFQVDASILVANGELSEDGMYLAGAFNNFTGEPMTEGADNIWTLELALNPGETYNYKFQNGPGGWEPNLPTDECGFGDFGDRQVTAGDMDMTLDVVCFGFCVTCNEVSVDDTQLKAGVQVFPNPVKDLLNVRVDLGETADNLTVRMLNPFGQVVTERYRGTFQTGNIEIDVSNIPAGAYMIQVMDGKAQFTQSVIVQ